MVGFVFALVVGALFIIVPFALIFYLSKKALVKKR
ncbi:hypothetical protein WCLP8_4790008 [uncultured Gammaproteobacteria bacterium]